ncbi:MAG: hypothetical protein ACRC7R_04625 [Sarcina sp.]
MKKNSLKQFYYLLNLEVCKSLKVIIPIFLATIIFRALAIMYIVNWKVGEFNEEVKTLGSIQQVLDKNGHIGLSKIYMYCYDSHRVLLYLGVALIGIYSLYIWIKEYSGANKTIYWLLNLPINKELIILSKFLTCIIIWLSFLATYLLGFFIDMALAKAIVPKDFFSQESIFSIIQQDYGLLSIRSLIFYGPSSLIINLIACTMILMAFIFILLKKSYGVKGAISGIILSTLVLYQYTIPDKLGLFLEETLLYVVFTSILIFLLAFKYSSYLLNKKVHI